MFLRSMILFTSVLVFVQGEQVWEQLPLPTQQQLAWLDGEIMALVHFNMATFFQNGDPGCTASNWNTGGMTNQGSSDVNNFAPTDLNISNWVESMKAVGINEAVLTAKHGCGFYLWNTNVTLPDGSRYPYRVNSSVYGDVLRTFAQTLGDANIGHGFYYSLTNNFFLNIFGHQEGPQPLLPKQHNVTIQQFEEIVVASLTELWSQYGNLTEIWFDGGYFDMAPRLLPILQKYQPNVVAFGGAGLLNSSVRWCGSEGEAAPGYPTIYSCDGGCDNGGWGCPCNTTGAQFVPSGVDGTLVQGDVWFYEPGLPIHPLSDLISYYHNSVGANGKMELDFGIDRTGNVAPNQAIAYKNFGDWIRSCYGTPVAAGTPPQGQNTFILPLSSTPGQLVTFDRIMMKEDLSFSQLVAGYQVEYQTTSGQWTLFSSGITIGRKRIDVGNVTNATSLRFTILDSYAPHHMSLLATFAPEPCAIPSTKVQFVYSNGQCLISNSTFPCPGGTANSCPVFLGSCADPTSYWNDDGDVIMNIFYSSPATGLNVDCNYATAKTPVKLLDGGANTIVFSSGQLVYTSPLDPSASVCLNGGLTPSNAPCNPSEQHSTNQISIDDCSDASTQGWTRVVVK